MSELEILTRQLHRERAARQQAESLLEEKSRELYLANEELNLLANDLRQQVELTTAILSAAAEGVITFDERGQIERFNPAAERIFACPSADFAQWTVQRLIDEGLNGFQSSAELLGRKADGSLFPMTWSVSELPLHEHRLFVAVVHDLTHRKELESRVIRAEKMESLGRLAAGVAHEINTPMQFIGDNLRFLRSVLSDVQFTQVAQVPNSDWQELVTEIPEAIDQALAGAERVTTIVKAVKEIAEGGSDDLLTTDLLNEISSCDRLTGASL